jgi:hypothetical protein
MGPRLKLIQTLDNMNKVLNLIEDLFEAIMKFVGINGHFNGQFIYSKHRFLLYHLILLWQ